MCDEEILPTSHINLLFIPIYLKAEKGADAVMVGISEVIEYVIFDDVKTAQRNKLSRSGDMKVSKELMV